MILQRVYYSLVQKNRFATIKFINMHVNLEIFGVSVFYLYFLSMLLIST